MHPVNSVKIPWNPTVSLCLSLDFECGNGDRGASGHHQGSQRSSEKPGKVIIPFWLLLDGGKMGSAKVCVGMRAGPVGEGAGL